MDDEINLLDYWRVIVNRKWLIVGLAFVCALSAFIYSVRQPKFYRATATIMTVEGGGGGLVSALSAVPFLSGGSAGGKLVPILKSKNLANKVAANVDLPAFFPNLLDNNSNSDNVNNLVKRSIVNSFRGAIQPSSSQGLLNITVIWHDPDQAAELANMYVKELGKFLNERSLNVNFHIIDIAIPPSSYFKPKPRATMLFGGGIGLFIGIFIAFLLQYLEKLSNN